MGCDDYPARSRPKKQAAPEECYIIWPNSSLDSPKLYYSKDHALDMVSAYGGTLIGPVPVLEAWR